MIYVQIDEYDLKILVEQIEAGICPIENLPREIMQIIYFVLTEYLVKATDRAETVEKDLDKAREAVATLEKITEKRKKTASMAQGAFSTVARLIEKKKEEACT